jgi:hypothetical protein
MIILTPVFSYETFRFSFTLAYHYLRDRRLGLADGPGLMASHWLGSRHWGLATGFPHRAFDQELRQSCYLTARSSAKPTTPTILSTLKSLCKDSARNDIT